MKIFYAAVIDDYEYHEVTEHRYKNFFDFALHCWGEKEMINQLCNYLDKDEDIDRLEWEDFFMDYYGYTVYYFAIDENNQRVEELEDSSISLRTFISEHIDLHNLKKITY